MSEIVSTAGSWVDRIKINVLSRECHEGRMMWIKRRNRAAGPIMTCANGFFRLSGNPIRALTEPTVWQRWEVDCFLRLHGGNFRAFAVESSAVAAEELPGQSLSAHLKAGTLTETMLRAAARELRRAHEDWCLTFQAPWSHGDPHSGNFIYEPEIDRARLIDFEVMHQPALPADERHADDLLILLQDLVGRIFPEPRWLPLAHAFLDGYDRPEIVARLRPKLVVPGGFARIWWAVRTTYMDQATLTRRIEALRGSI
jgi:hypothetical protein